ncbi:lysylphosphatidylglycerol synthase domain-containing protein [Paenibacillus lignilyticus]|uniref:Phosphatidylglycerol lysyltransferase n=1 Tax=Paenibacillus lignilyticus TaxID=1172615 RepID=A0ABS5CD82_9BACL|nr:lysylphosphatidylglycerol synthase domain-containing protein [Paenibacillus lignilyticus]MBP3963073.1 flippase-like domain-containing protein [Paenibacillus lignilyticus]
MAVLRRLAPTALKLALAGIIVFFVLRNMPLKLADIESFLAHASLRFYSSIAVFAFFLMLQAGIWVLIVNAAGEEPGKPRNGVKLPLLDGLRIFIDSQFGKYLPGGFWNYAGRVVLASRAGVSLNAQLAAIVYENVLLVSAALCYALILLVSLDIAPAASLFGVILLFALTYVYYNKGAAAIRALFVRVSRRVLLRRFFARLSSLRATQSAAWSGEAGLTRNRFFGCLACFLGSHFIMGIAFWLLTNSFEQGHIGLWYAAGTFATSWLLGLFSPLPGGLGVREGFLVYFLSLKLGAETALYISIIARLWNIMAEVLFWAAVRTVGHLTRRVRTYDEA